jgi:RecA/RadA recombinase
MSSESLLERLRKNSTVEETEILSESKFFGKKDMSPTTVPMINVALSGEVDGGLMPGLLMLAAPSKHFKSLFALLLASAYMRKYPDGVILFYDSEFGSPDSYFDAFYVDKSRVIHTPILDIEQLKLDVLKQLNALKKGDRVFFLIDSIGNLASKKETADAEKDHSASDTGNRAKELKSLWRLVRPHLTIKELPMVAINHTYKTIETHSKTVVGGGTGGYYSSDDIWIISREQEKESKTGPLQGFTFNVRIEKSRKVQEGLKIPVTVTFDKGIHQWSGLFDLAVEAGYIHRSGAWYWTIDPETGEIMGGKKFQRSNVENDGDFWIDLFMKTDLKTYIKQKFLLDNLANDLQDIAL